MEQIINMIQEHQKYRAELLKVIGFALLTPISAFVWDILRNGLVINTQFFVNLGGSTFLALIGTMILQEGYEELME